MSLSINDLLIKQISDKIIKIKKMIIKDYEYLIYIPNLSKVSSNLFYTIPTIKFLANNNILLKITNKCHQLYYSKFDQNTI